MTHVRDSAFYQKVYDATIKNAKRLFRHSEHAAQEGDYGLACSLNILAAEEAAKAVFLSMKKTYPESDINGFDEIFKDHKIKHKHLQSFAVIYDIMIRKLKPIIDLSSSLLNFAMEFPVAVSKAVEEKLSPSTETGQWIAKIESRKIELDEILEWLKNANTDKNKGLYVDIRNDTLLDPASIPKEKYEKEKHYAATFIDYVLNIEQMLVHLADFQKNQDA